MSVKQTLYQGTITHAYYSNSLKSIYIELYQNENKYITLLLPCLANEYVEKCKSFIDKTIKWQFFCIDNVIVQSERISDTSSKHCNIQ